MVRIISETAQECQCLLLLTFLVDKRYVSQEYLHVHNKQAMTLSGTKFRCLRFGLSNDRGVWVFRSTKIHGHCGVRVKTNKMRQLDVYYQYFLNVFRASLCPSSGEQDVCYCTWCAALVLLDVVGSGCGALRVMCEQVTFTLLAPNSNLHSAHTKQ